MNTMITTNQYFIVFSWKIEFDARIGEWVDQDVTNHMTLSVRWIDMWLASYWDVFNNSLKNPWIFRSCNCNFLILWLINGYLNFRKCLSESLLNELFFLNTTRKAKKSFSEKIPHISVRTPRIGIIPVCVVVRK